MKITKDSIRSTKKKHRSGAHWAGYLGISHLVTKNSEKDDWGIRFEVGRKLDGSDATSIQMDNEAVIYMIEEIFRMNATVKNLIFEPFAEITREAEEAHNKERKQAIQESIAKFEQEIAILKQKFNLD
jgi:hypothetical protein